MAPDLSPTLSPVDWERFPGPKYYRPAEVPKALEALAEIQDKRCRNDTYNRVLYSIGNNHAGTLYPAATAAAPRIVRIFANSKGLVQELALDILVDLVGFEAESGFESFQSVDGLTVDVKAEVLNAVRQGEEEMYRILATPDEREIHRVNALEVLWEVATNRDRVTLLVQRILTQQPGKVLRKQCEDLLAETETPPSPPPQ